MFTTDSTSRRINLAFELSRKDKAERLQKIVAPFRERALTLTKPLGNLEERARTAIFWRTFGCVSAVTASIPIQLHTKLDRSLGQRYFDRLHARMSVDDYDGLRRKIWDQVRPCTAGLQPLHKGPYGTTVFMACALVLIGNPEEAEKFDPLLALWRDGNFPLGFDRQRLVILVGD